MEGFTQCEIAGEPGYRRGLVSERNLDPLAPVIEIALGRAGAHAHRTRAFPGASSDAARLRWA